MQLEIWSDIACPFCYIGKRHLEAALAQLPDREAVEIIWRSFELDPSAPREYPGDLYDMLAQKFRTTREQAHKMNERVVQMATAAGLDFNFDVARPANSFDAHRLIQLARQHGRADEAEERIFAAYFTEGKSIADPETLRAIGAAIGLPAAEVERLLLSDDFADAVRADEQEAQRLGITGVPFFVFDRKYAISGAQPVSVFAQALERARYA
jgi:predicted DsbA family dithiol-disulfide isomerase